MRACLPMPVSCDCVLPLSYHLPSSLSIYHSPTHSPTPPPTTPPPSIYRTVCVHRLLRPSLTPIVPRTIYGDSCLGSSCSCRRRRRTTRTTSRTGSISTIASSSRSCRGSCSRRRRLLVDIDHYYHHITSSSKQNKTHWLVYANYRRLPRKQRQAYEHNKREGESDKEREREREREREKTSVMTKVVLGRRTARD